MSAQTGYRSLRGLEFRAAPKGSGFIGVLVGYAAVFDSDSLEFDGLDKPWVERIAPGAFKRTLKENPDVKALWAHRDDAILARAPKTLKLTEDTRGLNVEISLIDTQQNRDVLSLVRNKLVDAMSFGFRARDVKWSSGFNRDTRTLLDVELHEVSAVVWPAYPDTSLSTNRSARAATTGEELEQIRQERDRFLDQDRRSVGYWQRKLAALKPGPLTTLS